MVLRGRYEIVYLTVPLVVLAFVFANHFNIVGIGKEFSQNLGVPYNLVLFMGLTIAAMITASVVIVVGSISYIGLVVPNIVTMFKGDKIRGTLADTALFGALFVIVCDMISRVVIAPYELPIELIVGILGSILFVGLLLYRLKTEEEEYFWGKEADRMHSAVHKTNSRKLLVLGILVAAAAIAYLFVDVSFSNERLFRYAMKIRIPKLMVMLVASAAIGGATIVFQTIIHNTIVTPCLLGMNSLYTLIHTAVVFFAGSGSFLAVNANVSFVVDLFLMSTTAVLVYSYLFKKTNYNVLYVLLIGTVLTSFFGSIQSTLTRIMDPNEYDSLLATLVASFNNVNSEIILAAVLVLAGIVFVLRKELALLDVLSLGRHQAINLGVDYDRAIRKLLLGVTLCIATATAMVGPISFLGLIIANLSRQFLKTYRHSQLIMGSVFFGMFVLAAGQMISEQIFVYAIPVSVFITVGGGGYFLYLLLRKRRS